MLSEADASLIERDPGLAGLALLLDDDAFAGLLGDHLPGLGATAVAGRYVRYKRGTSCLVGFLIETRSGETRQVYARAHLPGASDKLARAEAGAAAVVPHLGVLVFVYPSDHELRGLEALGDRAARRDLLERLLPDPGDAALRQSPISVLRYKPERRCVLKLGDDRGPAPAAIIRFYTAEDYSVSRDAAAAFHDEGPLRLAPRLGTCREARATALRWIHGQTLAEDLRLDAAERVGAAIARLHAQHARKIDATWTAESFATMLADAAGALAMIRPDLGAGATALAQRIGQKLSSRHWRSNRAIHGDLAPEQIIATDDGAAIVDLDRAAWGDPRIDLGNFQARLVYAAIEAGSARPAADAFFEAVLESYRSASEKDVTRKVQRFTAAALLQAAVLPFRTRSADWSNRGERILDEARSFFEAGVEAAG